jgi:hypothetical protein
VLSAAMFDWQAELMVPSPIPNTRRVSTPHIPVVPSPVSFAQALTGTNKVVSNDNFPKPYIRGETLGIKITHDFYEHGRNFCKTN